VEVGYRSADWPPKLYFVQYWVWYSFYINFKFKN